MKLPFSIYRRGRATEDCARHAFTLVEMLMALGLGVVVLAAVLSVGTLCLRGFVGMYNYTDLNMQSRLALDRISKDIRGATGLFSYQTNSLVFSTTNAATTITYTYDPSARTLICDKTGQPQRTLLTYCDDWNFKLYQRTPGYNYTNIETTVPTLCKLVSMHWVCSRTIMGLKLNTETVQEAKIVLRN